MGSNLCRCLTSSFLQGGEELLFPTLRVEKEIKFGDWLGGLKLVGRERWWVTNSSQFA